MKKIVLPPELRDHLLERFLRYVKVETTSSETAPEDQCPSTECQRVLADMLAEELRALGVQNVHVTPFGYVHGELAGNLLDSDDTDNLLPFLPVIGFMSHLDTSQQASGKDVNPILVHDYKGGDLTQEHGEGILAVDNPQLAKCLGHTLIHTDGRTLLGADDKAGIAIIMTILDYLQTNYGHVPHGLIKICFNPDEEINRGTAKLDQRLFDPSIAYTADAGEEGEIEDECFSGRTATVTVKGVDIHPGYGYGKLVSAFRVFGWIMQNLPEAYRPDTTRDKQPYIHPYTMEKPGNTETFEFKVLLRAFTIWELDLMERYLRKVCENAELEFRGSKVTVDVKVGYFNMKDKLDERPEVMQVLLQACEIQGIKPINKPIRGGTDGSRMTVDLGIPTPNIWDGGINYHSVREWVSLNWMVSSVETNLQLLACWVDWARAQAEKSKTSAG